MKLNILSIYDNNQLMIDLRFTLSLSHAYTPVADKTILNGIGIVTILESKIRCDCDPDIILLCILDRKKISVTDPDKVKMCVNYN